MEQLMMDVFMKNRKAWLPIPKCRFGERIYHYTDLKALKGIVMDHAFWVTKSDFLNDKYEFYYAFKIIRKVCAKMIPNAQNRKIFMHVLKERMEFFHGSAADQVLAGWYILSFSKAKDSLLLWTEFSQSQGYCLEFDYKRLVKELPDGIHLDGYVIYDKKKQYELVENTLRQILEEKDEGRKKLREKLLSEERTVSAKELDDLMKEFAACCFVYSMFFKKDCFREEREYRFIFWVFHEQVPGSKDAQVVPMYFREKDQALLPYIVIDYKEEEKHSPICSITAGPKNDSDLAVKGMQYFLRNEKIVIPVRESKIPLRY